MCVTFISVYILPPSVHGNVQVKMNADFTKKDFCILTLRWLRDSEPTTLSRLEIGLRRILTVGGEREVDILVNMRADLSQQFWACSQVERCVDQVLTLLKGQKWSFSGK